MAGLALLQVVATALGAHAIGRRMLARRVVFDHPATQTAAECGLGLAALSMVLYLAAYGGYLTQTPLVGAPLLGVLGLVVIAAAAADARRTAAALRCALGCARRDRWLAMGLVAFALYFVWMFLGAILPPTSLDEMVYHLEVPKRILQVGYLPVFTDNVLAYYPLGPQMFFLAGLAFAGETAARLYHLMYGALVLLALYGVLRGQLGRVPSLLGSALFMTIPTVMVIGHWAYIDLNFTLYSLVALVATMNYIRARDRSEREGLPWAVAAGLFAGCAWTVKYTGLQLVLLLVLLVLVEHLRSRPRQVPFGVVALCAVAFALFVPHLARTWSITGWPLFPFALGPFELTGAVNWSAGQSDLALAWQRQYGAGYERNLFERLMASVWVFTSASDNYTAYDGVAGCAFLMAPLVLLIKQRSREIRMLTTFSAVYLFYWSLTTTQVRFLVPGLAPLAILVAFVAARGVRRVGLPALAALIALNVGLGAASLVRYEPWLLWTGQETRSERLTRLLGPYTLYMDANRLLAEGDRLYLVNMRTWGYLLDLPGRGEMSPFPNGWRSDYTFEHYNLNLALERASSLDDVAAYFRERDITHVMIDEAVTLSPDALAEREARLLAAFLRERAILLVRNRRDPVQSLWRLDLERRILDNLPTGS